MNTKIETDLSPSAPGQSINPLAPAPAPAEEEEEEERKKSESSQSDLKHEYSVCKQTHNVQGRKRAKTTNTQCPGQEESENNTPDDAVSYPINQQDVPTPCKQGSFPNEERGTAEKQTRDDLHIRSGQTDHKQGD